MQLHRRNPDTELAEWFPDEEVFGPPRPLYQKYVNLILFFGLVSTVLWVYRQEPLPKGADAVPVAANETSAVAESAAPTHDVDVSGREIVVTETEVPIQSANTSLDIHVKSESHTPNYILHGKVYKGLRKFKNPEIRELEAGYELEFGVSRVFSAGFAELNENAVSQLEKLADRIQTLAPTGAVVIESYTDDSPITKQQHLFATNYDLSVARGNAIAEVLRSRGFDSRKIQVVGFGSENPRYPNRGPNDEILYGNRVDNRRVILRLK